ncbi:MAG: hypothetical protein ABIH70_01280 [Chloroflexota bacterium]
MKYKKIFRALVFLLTLSLLLSTFPVQPVLAATTSITPATGPAGTAVSVTGAGFTTNLTFRNRFAYGTTFEVVRTGTVSASGTITDNFTIPVVPHGSYTVRLETDNENSSTTFSVTQAINLSTTSAKVGDYVNIGGTGFTASRTVLIAFDSVNIATTTTNTNGSFSTTFTVPASVSGTHTVTASDGVIGASASLSTTQKLTLLPTSGTVGTSVTITGNGFGANRQITVTLGGYSIVTSPTTIVSSNAGDFTATFVVPVGASRTPTVVASDGTVSANTLFNLLASLRLNPDSASVGSTISVSGTGFSANDSITVSFDTTQVAETASDTNGNFSTSFTVPNSYGGAHSMTASDGTYSASTTFNVLGSITVNPSSGKVRSQTAVSGTGFNPSRSVNISFDNALQATTTTDSTGSFNTSVTVPLSAAGSHTITANDGTLSSSSPFITQASMTITPTRGPMGAEITVSGIGFLATTAITVQLGGNTAQNTTTDTNGSFTTTFTVPQMTAGTYTLITSDGANAVSVEFTITASFSINPSAGHVGSTVLVSGTGFNGLVTIKYDSDALATATADASRAFSATFTVPTSVHGPHIVSVSDTVYTIQVTFTMESNTPPVPEITRPKVGSRQGRQPTLTWTAVDDPSGVTYIMQMATDTNFTSLIAQKPGLTAPQFTFTGTEKLPSVSKSTPYYWRVKAVDLAQNEGDWSLPGTFYVSVFPDWAKWTLIGIGSLFLVLAIFWLGMRMGHRSG